MKAIARIEKIGRGPYCGAVAWMGFDGAMDSAIAIRTMTYANGVVAAQAGGGIVADSDPADEEDNVLIGNNVQQNNPAAPAPVQGHQVAETQMQEVYVEGRPSASGGHELARAYYAYVMQLLEAGFSYSRSIISQHGGRADIYVRPMPRREE